MAFVDESYQAPGPAGDGYYTVTGALVDRDRMVSARRALLRVTGGKPWHTTEAHRTSPAMIGRMTTAIATETYNNTLVVSTPWTEGSAATHRADSMRVLLTDLSRMGARVVVLDSMDATAQERDRRVVNTLRAQSAIARDTLMVYADDTKEALLWVPDTIGWSVGRLLVRDEHEWSRDLEDVVAVKESQHGGWVDLASVRSAAAVRGARAELEAQVAAIRSATFPATPPARDLGPVQPRVRSSSPKPRRTNEGPAL